MKPLTKAQRVAVAQVIVEIVTDEGSHDYSLCGYCVHYEEREGGEQDGVCAYTTFKCPTDRDDYCMIVGCVPAVERIAADLRRRLEAEHEAQ